MGKSKTGPMVAVEDKIYLTGDILEASNQDDPGAQANTVNYARMDGSTAVSRRAYSINLATGSDRPLPEGETTLAGLRDSIASTRLKSRIDG